MLDINNSVCATRHLITSLQTKNNTYFNIRFKQQTNSIGT